MSTAAAAVRFVSDGLVMWGTFQATAMVLHPALHPYWDDKECRANPWVRCNCGRAEDVEVWVCYGGEFYYSAKACRHCKAVTTNLDYEDVRDEKHGCPAWVPNPWPLKPSESALVNNCKMEDAMTVPGERPVT